MMYPDDPMQPGPIYFVVQRCCDLFGVHAERMSSLVEGHGAGHAEPTEAGTEDVPCK